MCDTLAVIPIFVNAGTALLPAIVAPLASVLALLLRPRQLIATLRRNPSILMGLVLGAFLLWWGIGWMLGPGTAAGAGGARNADRPVGHRIDWAKVANDRIEKKKRGGVAAVVVSVASTNPAGHSAVMYRQGNTRSGYDGGPVPVGLVPLWSYGADGALIMASPVVRGERVFAATYNIDAFDPDPATKQSGSVFCVDASSGAVLWTCDKVEGKPLKPILSTPAITGDGKYLVVGQGLHLDANSDLICLDAQTGRLHWRVKTLLHVESSPAILGDMAVVGVGDIEGTDGYALAVRISDGKELWRHSVIDAEGSPVISPEGIVYIGSGFGGNAVYALRGGGDEELKKQKQDRVLWKVDTKYPIAGAATLVDDLVIVGGGNGDYVKGDPHPAGVVLALDARTGKERWQTPMPDAVLGAVAVGDGKVVCAVRDGQVIALNLSDGKPIWQQRVSEKAPVLAGPAVAGRYVFAVANDGNMAVIGLADGKLVKRYYLNDTSKPPTIGMSISSPTIAGGRVYVGSETGGLRGFGGEKVEP